MSAWTHDEQVGGWRQEFEAILSVRHDIILWVGAGDTKGTEKTSIIFLNKVRKYREEL